MKQRWGCSEPHLRWSFHSHTISLCVCVTQTCWCIDGETDWEEEKAAAAPQSNWHAAYKSLHREKCWMLIMWYFIRAHREILLMLSPLRGVWSVKCIRELHLWRWKGLQFLPPGTPRSIYSHSVADTYLSLACAMDPTTEFTKKVFGDMREVLLLWPWSLWVGLLVQRWPPAEPGRHNANKTCTNS